MKLSRRDLLISAGGMLAASALPAWAGPARALRGRAFGASWKLVSGGAFDEVAVHAAIESVVESVDGAMSPFRADSEITRFNGADTTGWQPLSADTCVVLREGLRVAALTSDAFNPTVGPLVGRYGFGPIGGTETGGAREIGLRDGMVRKLRPSLSLDLCGIAKGHALDRIVSACTALGLTDFLVELGGEVYARGRHPGGRGWHVGVERPLADTTGLLQLVVGLDGQALATSGNAVNGYRYGARRYSHIIDPTTARPADTTLASVTVVAASAITADAMATALYAMGPERGPDFAEAQGIEALFISEDGGNLRETATSGFSARILA